MRKFSWGVIAVFIVFLSGCSGRVSTKSGTPVESPAVVIKYAKDFAVFNQNGNKKVVVYNPWKKGKVLASFVLVKSHPQNGEIQVPLDSVAVFSSTQLNALRMLGVLDKVTGISEARFISNPEVKKALSTGKMTELSAGGHYFIERILEQKPQAIFFSPFQGNLHLPRTLSTLTAIPYLDYTEKSPLGRAEWIKFSALFFGKEKEADSIFRGIEKQYLTLEKLADTLTERPTVFSDKFFSGQWFVPGGRSYIARIFHDAGANYLWHNDTHIASFPLNFETVFQKAQNADYWRIIGTFGSQPSYREIADENELYTHFKAFKEHHIIYCDPKKTAYFERSAMEPQWVLADFIKAFHPKLLPDYQPVFYRLLK